MIIRNLPHNVHVGASLCISPNNGIGLAGKPGYKPGQQTKGGWQGGAYTG